VTLLRQEDGQTAALALLALTALLGISALVLDVGSWLRVQRKLQATVDAAALAGAQYLPQDPTAAAQAAQTYISRNGGDPAQASVSLPAGDEITVDEHEDAPSFFANVFHISSARVGAHATALARTAGTVRYVAPIAVSEQHPMLQCRPQPCFDQPTQIDLADLKFPDSSTAAGNFGLLDLDGDAGGSASTSVLADWLRNGYSGPLGVGVYEGAPGAHFNAAPFDSALNARVGTEVLFPVYRSITGSGSGAAFNVVGWVAFKLTRWTASGSGGTLYGQFTRVTWDGVGDAGAPDYGVRTIALVQ
jgi:Putative Flp pilus-assembly TadE/G-like